VLTELSRRVWAATEGQAIKYGDITGAAGQWCGNSFFVSI
jgi:hypothetical protein